MQIEWDWNTWVRCLTTIGQDIWSTLCNFNLCTRNDNNSLGASASRFSRLIAVMCGLIYDWVSLYSVKPVSMECDNLKTWEIPSGFLNVDTERLYFPVGNTRDCNLEQNKKLEEFGNLLWIHWSTELLQQFFLICSNHFIYRANGTVHFKNYFWCNCPLQPQQGHGSFSLARPWQPGCPI